jgi:hypothetical protein
MTPRRRIWLYQPTPGELEVTIMGSPSDVDAVGVPIINAMIAWSGFGNVSQGRTGGDVVVVFAVISRHAGHTDAIAEALSCIGGVQLPRTFEWHDSYSGHPDGIIGTW